jgi:hypothetical protein
MAERQQRGSGTLEPVVCAALGLASGEGARIRLRGPRVVLVERRPFEDPHVPAACGLTLSADIRSFPLPDVLGWLHRAGRSGLLHYSHHEHAKWMWLHRGEVVFASSNQSIDRLGPSLLRAGVLSLEQMRDADRRPHAGTRFGKVLVERGILTPRQLWAGLQKQAEEICHSLFAYSTGWLCFWEGDLQPDNVVRLSLSIPRLVQDGMRWRDEMRRLLAALADARVRIERVAAAQHCLAGTERVVFDALGDETTFLSLHRRVGLDALTAARVLYLLHRAGAVRIRRGDDDPDRTQRVLRHDPAERLRSQVQDTVKLLGELAAVLVARDGADRLVERFGASIEEVAERFPGLLAGVRPSRNGTLDPELLIERALALPFERHGDVREALAALVDYLEFEVKNHPGIADPDEVLRSVEVLRATLRS